MAQTTISEFQPGHSWVKFGTPGTVTDDTVVYYTGTQSLKLVTDGASGESKIRWTGISPAFNMTGKFFKMWVRIDDIDELNRLWIYAASTAWSAYYAWKPSDAPSHWLDSGGGDHGSNAAWICISLSQGEVSTLGSPDRSSIVALQLYAQDKGAVPVTINFGALYAVDEQGTPVVTFSFDDNWESIYTQGFAYLTTTKGKAAINYLTCDDLGTAGRMTQANVDALYAGGWDIGGHYGTELDDVPDVGATLDYVQDYLDSHGYNRGVLDFALPGGVWNEGTVMPAVKSRFRSCRTIIPYGETRPPGDNYKLRTMEVMQTTTLATVEGRVDRCYSNKEWLILVFHRLVAVPSTSLEWAISDFQALVDYIIAKPVEIKTVCDVLNLPVSSPGPGNWRRQGRIVL